MPNKKKEYIFEKTNEYLQKAETSEAFATYRFKNYSQLEGKYPFYADHAKGAYIWDVDGNKYIDYMMGYGSVILGHADTRVTNAVIKELKEGNNISPLWKPIQIELTKILVSIIPGGEMAYLMKSGSDATSGAIRIARAYTQRNKVIRWGYHGWHDWATGVMGGVPEHIKDDIFELKYNDIESVQKIFEKYPDEVACIIMMPFELEPPKEGFLDEVKSIAHKYGALFILDEMRSGFRISLGGAQEFFNIEADLATFSKAMSNGYPISAIVGKREIMQLIQNIQIGSTFIGNTPEIAAAIETINILKTSDALNRIWRNGEYLQEETRKLILDHKVNAEIIGYPPFPFIRFTFDDTELTEKAKTAFYCEAVKHGIFLHPNHHGYISASHTKKDIEKTLDVFDTALKSVKETL